MNPRVLGDDDIHGQGSVEERMDRRIYRDGRAGDILATNPVARLAAAAGMRRRGRVQFADVFAGAR